MLSAKMKSYILHTRPRSWLVVAGHLSVGYFIALPPQQWFAASNVLMLALGAAIWTLLLNGGTLAFNSAFDNDAGDIGYLDSPPPVPPKLWLFGLILILAGLPLSFLLLPLTYVAAYGASVILSLLYSCPPVRLKARAGFDILINMIGYGGLTTFAGWASVSSEIPPSIILVCVGYMFLFAAFYPFTQIYQYEEDRAKGDRTFAVMLGPSRALKFSAVALLCAFVMFAVAVPPAVPMPYLALAPALAAWLAVLVPWMLKGRAYPEKKGMYRGLWAWGATDVLVVVAFAVV